MSDYKDPSAVLQVCGTASPEPWHWSIAGDLCSSERQKIIITEEYYTRKLLNSRNDINFIALARTALPYWVQRAVELETENRLLHKDVERHKSARVDI